MACRDTRGPLWRLLQHYNIPTFLFVNKMDLPGADKEVVQQQLKTELSDGCVDFTQDSGEAFFEEAAMGSEALLDEYMDQGSIAEEHLAACGGQSANCFRATMAPHSKWRV